MPQSTSTVPHIHCDVQVLEHAKEEKVSIRRLETVEEVLKEADVGSVCTAVAHALQHRLHVWIHYSACPFFHLQP